MLDSSKLSLGVLCAAVLGCAGSAAPRHVVLFMPDDMPFYWDESPRSPRRPGVNPEAGSAHLLQHMNAVRENGVTFELAYTTGPKCAPSRYGLMTGRLPSRGLYAQANRLSVGQARTMVQVPQTKLTGADLDHTVAAGLAAAGVATIESGKWHIAEAGQASWDDYPAAAAAVESAGFGAAAAVYITNMDNHLGTGGIPAFSHNLEWMVAEANDAVDAALAADDGRFFLYFAPTNPHSPSNLDALGLEPTATPNGAQDSALRSGMPARSTVIERAGGDDTLAGVIGCDDALGALLGHIDGRGKLDDTLVIVTMDHGQIAKDQVYEAGTRTVLMMQHTGGAIAPGSRVPAVPVTNLDLVPTIFDAVLGDPAPAGFKLDGVSLWPAATAATADGAGAVGAELANRKCVVFEIDQVRAVVCGGRWKFVSGAKQHAQYPDSGEPEQLYDLAADPQEQTSLLGLADPATAAIEANLRAYIACHDADTAPTGGPGCDTAVLNPLGVDDVADATAAPTTAAPTTAAPTTASTTTATTTTTTKTAPTSCTDSLSWVRDGKPKHDCARVALKPNSRRCGWTDAGGTAASTACPAACSTCPAAADLAAPAASTAPEAEPEPCSDSVIWHQDGRSSRTCAWAASNPNYFRCNRVVDAGGVTAARACPVACDTCPEVGAATSASVADSAVRGAETGGGSAASSTSAAGIVIAGTVIVATVGMIAVALRRTKSYGHPSAQPVSDAVEVVVDAAPTAA